MEDAVLCCLIDNGQIPFGLELNGGRATLDYGYFGQKFLLALFYYQSRAFDFILLNDREIWSFDCFGTQPASSLIFILLLLIRSSCLRSYSGQKCKEDGIFQFQCCLLRVSEQSVDITLTLIAEHKKTAIDLRPNEVNYLIMLHNSDVSHSGRLKKERLLVVYRKMEQKIYFISIQILKKFHRVHILKMFFNHISRIIGRFPLAFSRLERDLVLIISSLVYPFYQSIFQQYSRQCCAFDFFCYLSRRGWESTLFLQLSAILSKRTN